MKWKEVITFQHPHLPVKFHCVQRQFSLVLVFPVSYGILCVYFVPREIINPKATVRESTYCIVQESTYYVVRECQVLSENQRDPWPIRKNITYHLTILLSHLQVKKMVSFIHVIIMARMALTCVFFLMFFFFSFPCLWQAITEIKGKRCEIGDYLPYDDTLDCFFFFFFFFV